MITAVLSYLNRQRWAAQCNKHPLVSQRPKIFRYFAFWQEMKAFKALGQNADLKKSVNPDQNDLPFWTERTLSYLKTNNPLECCPMLSLICWLLLWQKQGKCTGEKYKCSFLAQSWQVSVCKIAGSLAPLKIANVKWALTVKFIMRKFSIKCCIMSWKHNRHVFSQLIKGIKHCRGTMIFIKNTMSINIFISTDKLWKCV